MAEINNGGPAFPLFDHFHGEIVSGMSLRDWFAGQAMTALLGGSIPLGWGPQEFAALAYDQADAMLAERAEKAAGKNHND